VADQRAKCRLVFAAYRKIRVHVTLKSFSARSLLRKICIERLSERGEDAPESLDGICVVRFRHERAMEHANKHRPLCFALPFFFDRLRSLRDRSYVYQFIQEFMRV